METMRLKRAFLVLAILITCMAAVFSLYNEPAAALVHELECPALPTCGSTQYLKIYGWCDEPESCTMYRYSYASSPHCMVCN